jgi:DNA repair exonuclease SbcCD ATPase subunit
MLLVFLALILAAVVADVAVESALADGTSLVAAGQELASGLDPAVVTLGIAGASALAGIALVRAIGSVRRRERSTRLHALHDEVSQAQAALEARRQMIESRLGDLQRNHDEVLARRDELLTEVERLRERRAELEERVRERHREIAAARRELGGITVESAAAEAAAARPSASEPPDELTVVPDVAEPREKPWP